jgi:hypothetical protein
MGELAGSPVDGCIGAVEPITYRSGGQVVVIRARGGPLSGGAWPVCPAVHAGLGGGGHIDRCRAQVGVLACGTGLIMGWRQRVNRRASLPRRKAATTQPRALRRSKSGALRLDVQW